MAGYQIVINVDIGETRVALIENGIVAELHIERKGDRDVVGDVYLGKVTRVLPGMNAAFVDIGLERAAFLHVDDALSDAEFRSFLPDEDALGASLSRARRERAESAGKSVVVGELPPDVDLGEVRAYEGDLGNTHDEETRGADLGNTHDEETHGADLGDTHDHEETHGVDLDDTHDHEETHGVDLDDTHDHEETHGVDLGDAHDHEETHGVDLGDAHDHGHVHEHVHEIDLALEPSETDSVGGVSGSTVALFSAVVESAEATFTTSTQRVSGIRPERARERYSNRGGRSDNPHGHGSTRDRRGAERKGSEVSLPRQGEVRSSEARDPRNPSKGIREVLREGQEVVVQVSKGPISTKGARVTSHISLPGRYVVYMPTVDHVGVSKRIGNEKERRRLREVIDSMKPDKGGLIVRTLSEGLTKKHLKTDVGYLVRLWADICKQRETAKAPALLYSELDITLRAVRDVFGPECDKIVVDDRETHARVVRFVEQFMPDRRNDVELYTAREPIFDAYGIEDEIGRALARKVPLRSGGYLIIDQAEALTAIDVNTGRFVGKKDVEETVTATNIEAVAEIAYQLRLRNLGGLIVIDFIDMDRLQNRERVYNALGEALRNDKAKTTTVRISELGLVEMTRKRTRESLGRTLFEPCFYCDGTGHTSSRLTVAYEILRQIRREKDDLKGYSITVNAHPAVADTLKHEAAAELSEAQRRYARQIVVTGRAEYHIEQFDLVGA